MGSFLNSLHHAVALGGLRLTWLNGTADTDADIVGEAIELIASTGIGNAAQLEVNGVQLAAVVAISSV